MNAFQAILATSDGQGILDLKARCHGICYAQKIFKILPKRADVISIKDRMSTPSSLDGSIPLKSLFLECGRWCSEDRLLNI